MPVEYNKASIKLVSHSMRSSNHRLHGKTSHAGHKNSDWRLLLIHSQSWRMVRRKIINRCIRRKNRNVLNCCHSESFIAEFIIKLHLKCWATLSLNSTQLCHQRSDQPDKVNLSKERWTEKSHLWQQLSGFVGWAKRNEFFVEGEREILCRITASVELLRLTGNNFCEKSVECARGGLKRHDNFVSSSRFLSHTPALAHFRLNLMIYDFSVLSTNNFNGAPQCVPGDEFLDFAEINKKKTSL